MNFLQTRENLINLKGPQFWVKRFYYQYTDGNLLFALQG